MNAAPLRLYETGFFCKDCRLGNVRKGQPNRPRRSRYLKNREDGRAYRLQDWPATWLVEEAQQDLSQGTHATMPRWPAVASEQIGSSADCILLRLPFPERATLQRMDKRRRQLGADCGQDIHHHIAERHRSSGETGVQSKVLPLAQPKQAFISPTRAKVSRWLDHDGETRRSTRTPSVRKDGGCWRWKPAADTS